MALSFGLLVEKWEIEWRVDGGGDALAFESKTKLRPISALWWHGAQRHLLRVGMR